MTRIRRLEICNFRGIENLEWFPHSGINCLVGPGDSGKSTILDAIEIGLGSRRNIQFSDSDFFNLDVSEMIKIGMVLGDLPNSLRNIEDYGRYLSGFRAETGELLDDPEVGAEDVVYLICTIDSHLESRWFLHSEAAIAEGKSRDLSWSDRTNVAPVRIGAGADYQLSWRKGSVVSRISDEKPDASPALAEASRIARTAFGDTANEPLKATLERVRDKAKELGVPVGKEVRAMLDASVASLGSGTISLHSSTGVPLRAMGLGSTRLLIAGLQREAAAGASVLLVDELEHGLEPHRIKRFLDTLGAKDENPPLQVFMSTHSAAAVRELKASQLVVLTTSSAGVIETNSLDGEDSIQGTIRLFPEALLARSIIVCEGATEVGLLRGLDQWRVSQGKASLFSTGTALVDGNGDETFKRALAFQRMGYRTAILRDSDVVKESEYETQFKSAGGSEFRWEDGDAIEDALFLGLSDRAVSSLIEYVVEVKGERTIDDQIKSASENRSSLASVRNALSTAARRDLAKAAGSKRSSEKRRGWFKNVALMEEPALEIVGPDIENWSREFGSRIESIFSWVSLDG